MNNKIISGCITLPNIFENTLLIVETNIILFLSCGNKSIYIEFWYVQSAFKSHHYVGHIKWLCKTPNYFSDSILSKKYSNLLIWLKVVILNCIRNVMNNVFLVISLRCYTCGRHQNHEFSLTKIISTYRLTLHKQWPSFIFTSNAMFKLFWPHHDVGHTM